MYRVCCWVPSTINHGKLAQEGNTRKKRANMNVDSSCEIKFDKVCQELERLEMIQNQLHGHTGECSSCCCGVTLRRVDTTSTSHTFLPYLEKEAKGYIEKYSNVNESLALRCYTSNLIGKQKNLVLHGGGNTSVKFVAENEVFGDRVQVLGVKGSGYGLDTIPPEGFPQLKLKHLHRMVQQSKLTDVQMVKELRANMLDPTSPNPSVETLLHASLPFKFVDHSHADAIVALGNLPPKRAREMIAKAYEGSGLRVGVVKYIMPGFGLAKHVAEVYRRDPKVNCLILLNHGLFTWGHTAKESYERHVRCVDMAQRFADRFPPLTLRHLDTRTRTFSRTRILATIRGLFSEMSNNKHWYLRHRKSKSVETLLQSEQCEDLVMRGPITPDHVIRSKGWPMIVRFPKSLKDQDLTQYLRSKLKDYAADYESYFKENNDGTKVMLDTLPRVLLLEGIGLVTAGKTIKAVDISADIYEHTVPTILSTARMGEYNPVSRDHLFDCEYWELEQRKLRLKKSVPGSLQGHVAIVTGGCSGIGLATAELYIHSGACVVVVDIRQDRVESAVKRLKELAGGQSVVLGMCADVTDEVAMCKVVDSAVGYFGGVDILVSNAGVVVQASPGMASCARDVLEKSMNINFFSHQWITSAVVRTMIEQNMGGSLLYNVSKAPLNPGAKLGPYCIAKAATLALMRQYALEYGKHGIRANAVNPDRIRTNLFDMKLVEDRAKARGLTASQYFANNLLNKEVLAVDVAKAFLHLALSTKTSCAILQVDGGNIAAAPR